jgi:hypothetical protein
MDWESELDEALGLSPSASPEPSPTSDRSSGFVYDPYLVYSVSEREGSPARPATARRRPSKRRCGSSGAAGAAHACPAAAAAPAAAEAASGPEPASSSGAQQGLECPSPAVRPQRDADAPPPGSGCALQALPLQLLLRLLSFLSAQDLTAVAQASSLLRSLADEPVLWRRLYCARWGKPRGPQQPKAWKVRVPRGLRGRVVPLASVRRHTHPLCHVDRPARALRHDLGRPSPGGLNMPLDAGDEGPSLTRPQFMVWCNCTAPSADPLLAPAALGPPGPLHREGPGRAPGGGSARPSGRVARRRRQRRRGLQRRHAHHEQRRRGGGGGGGRAQHVRRSAAGEAAAGAGAGACGRPHGGGPRPSGRGGPPLGGHRCWSSRIGARCGRAAPTGRA